LLSLFIILAVAALGDFFLTSLPVRKKLSPMLIVFIHAAVAIIDVLSLINALYLIRVAFNETWPAPTASSNQPLPYCMLVAGQPL